MCLNGIGALANDRVYFSHVWHLGRKEKKDSEGRVHYIDGLIKHRAALKDLQFPDGDALKRKLEKTLELLEGTGFGLICGAQTTGFTVPTATGYIVASSHDLHQLVPIENIYAMRDAVYNYQFNVKKSKD